MGGQEIVKCFNNFVRDCSKTNHYRDSQLQLSIACTHNDSNLSTWSIIQVMCLRRYGPGVGILGLHVVAPGSNPDLTSDLDLFQVVPDSTLPRFVNSQLVASCQLGFLIMFLLQYCAKRMQTNFNEIRLLCSWNFGEISLKFRGKKFDFSAEISFLICTKVWLHDKNSLIYQTKFQLELVRTETRIKKPNRNIVILKRKFHRSVS